jgi:septum site-determining protein MinC
MSIDTPVTHRTALEFKSSSLNVPALVLLNNDLNQIKLQLLEKTAQAPEFFKNSPLLLDMHEINNSELELPLSDLVDLLRQLNFFPIGIRGGNEQQKLEAIKLKLPSHSSSGNKPTTASHPTITVTEKPETAHQDDVAENKIVENKLIEHPVRSGQRIYARGDLTVTATVSAGAEIMAEGNIHVYGTLRGRALAGVQGDKSCRIFCNNLQAELISIAGNYQISDELDDSVRNKPVQIYLQDQSLIISKI